MPFLRAALIKQKKLEPAIEEVKVVLPPVVEEEQKEPEEEFTPVQIEDLHRLIDIRTEEAELAEREIPPESVIVVVHETPQEIPEAEIIAEIEDVLTETPTLEAVQEVSEPEVEIITEPEDVLLETTTLETVQEVPEPEDIFTEAPTLEAVQEVSEPEAEIITKPEDVLPETTTLEAVQEITEPETPQEAPELETEPDIDFVQETPEPDSLPEIQQAETQQDLPEPETSQEQETVIAPEDEIEILPETSDTQTDLLPEITQSETAQDFDENSLLSEPEIPETQPTITPEPEIIPDVTPEHENETEQEISQPEKSHKDYSGSQLDYDFTSGERYVDKVSTKTEFDKMLDELANISKELLSWQADKFARDYTGKFTEGESSQAEARKYEAFLGGYITNAAMMLYDKGYRDAALKQLEQAISILQARKKLEDETSAIKSRVEEQNDAVDLSDILGLFGDG